MCDAFVIIQNVAHQRDTCKNNNDFSVSRVSIVICLLHPVFFPPIQPEYYVLFFFRKKKPQMNWCGEIMNCFLFYFRSVFKLYFIVFFLSFFLFQVLFSLIWFSRVCLNHSLLTYKVCLNKHVLFVCFGLVCMYVWLHVFIIALQLSIYCIFALELIETIQTRHRHIFRYEIEIQHAFIILLKCDKALLSISNNLYCCKVLTNFLIKRYKTNKNNRELQYQNLL